MALHPAKEEALLVWINGLRLDEPVQRIIHLQDGTLLLKLVYKLKGEEPRQAPVHLPQAERLSIVSDFLHGVCHVEECVLLTLAKGRMLELELTKVVLLLCYYGLVNCSVIPKMEFETELQMATMLRYVQEGERGLCLREGLDKLLTTDSLIHTSMSSTSSLGEDGSPVFSRLRHSPLVSFVELNTVASSSFFNSPLQELMSTPQVQVKRLRKELAREGDVRDELERELAERISLLSERERQISQLQHRLQRLQRDQEEMEKDHKATLTELQQKNDGLLTRVHEVLKQCRDLKTDNSQKERRIDELMEENGMLAVQARSATAQLTRAQEEVTKITEAHESSQMKWGNKKDLLQRELSQALADKECLTEQLQILQGKSSVLEDELVKLSQQPQEKGEVLGPIIEREKLKQDLTDLTLKLSQLQDTISFLEKEKNSVEALLAEERSSFEKELLHLEEHISDLQQSIKNIHAEKEAQELASRTKQEMLNSQIAALETDLARLQQLEVQLTAEITVSTELRQQRGALESKVASLEDMVNMLQSKCQNIEAKTATQQEVLNTVKDDLQNAQISLVEYEKKLADHQKVVEENASLRARISALDDTIANLQTELDAERKRAGALLTLNEEQNALMEEKFQQQEKKAHEMFTELETLSQELRKMKHQKIVDDSCIEKLTQERTELKASLAEERERGQSQLTLVNNAREERETELQQIITENQSKLIELQSRIEETVESLKQSESELSGLKVKLISKDGELGKRHEELAHLQDKADNLQRHLMEVETVSQQLNQDMESKDKEVQYLKVELKHKEEELQSLEVKSTEMQAVHQKEVEEQRLAIAELKLQLAEAEKRILEKVKSLDEIAQQLKDLREELSMERQRAATLEIILKSSKEAHEVQEQTLRLEVTRLQQETDEHLKKLEESLIELNSLKQEMFCQQDVALQKEQEVLVLLAQQKSLEDNFAQLQNKLAEATTLAIERQTAVLKLQEEVKHQENLRTKAQEFEETEHKALQREISELQARVLELTSLASEREKQLDSLCEKMKEQEDHNQKLLQKSDDLQKELENVAELKGQLECANHQTAAKTELLEATEEKLKQMEVMYKQKETLATEALQTKETLERTVTELCSKQKEYLDSYQQDLEVLKKENESLTLVKESLSTECQTLQAENKEQQEKLTAIKVDLHNAQDRHQQELGTLLKEKDHLASLSQSLESECQKLQAEHKVQLEGLNVLKADLQNKQKECQQEIETLKNENEHLSSVNQSLQSECHNLLEVRTVQQEELIALKADVQESKEQYEKDLESMKNEKDQLVLVNQSLQSECQTLQEVKTVQQEELIALKADLQESKEKYVNDLEMVKNDKEQLVLVNQSLQSECQTLQEVKTVQQEELNTLKADLHGSKEKYEKDLETMKKEQEQLVLVNRSLQSECQTLQKVKTVQQEELIALKADLQESKEKYVNDLEMVKNDKEQLVLVNQSLQSECQTLQEVKTVQQEELNTLKADLHGSKEKYEKDLETMKKEQEQLVLVNRSLQSECQTLQEVKTVQQEELIALKADLQESKEKYVNDLEMVKNDKEQLVLVNQSLQSECQTLQEVKTVQQEELNTLKADLQGNKEKYEKDLETMKKEQEQLVLVNRSLQSECQTLQEVKTVQQEELNTLKADLQGSKEKYEKDLETMKKEQEQLVLVNRSLQSECQTLQEVKTVQQEELNTLKVTMKECMEKYDTDVEAIKNESEHLAIVNQSLQREFQTMQEEKTVSKEELIALKANLQETKEKYEKDLEILRLDKDNLASVNLSLQKDLEAAQMAGAKLASVKEVAQQRETELEVQVKDLLLKINEFSSLADEREAEIRKLQLDLKRQLGTQESEKVLRGELETTVTHLRVEVEEATKLASEKQSELGLLQDQYEESEKQKQDACQANKVLEKDFSELRVKQNQELEEYSRQLEVLANEKDALAAINQSLQAERQAQQEALNDLQSSLQQEVKTLKKEREHLSLMNQLLQRECDASQRLGAELEAKLKGQTESVSAMKEALQNKEKWNQELQEQLKVKADAVEHYKEQVEKVKMHYNSRKQQLLEEKEERQALQASLETSTSELKALKAELKLLNVELKKTQDSEKSLLMKIKSLEAQLNYADRQIREQKKQGGQSVQANPREILSLKVPEHLHNSSVDSLDFNLEDSLNAAGKQSVPGESSTPLVRSSERLAAKRRAQDGGSLETLYFTPMMQQNKKRGAASQDNKLESSITSLGELTLNSARKPCSSVQRRRTTQVINITMTKKTPLGNGAAPDAEDSFFSLHTTQSQPNLASQKSRPVSADVAIDHSKLLGLPGFRPSNAQSSSSLRTLSTFCLGSEYEPEHITDDWMRIAELQSRNKACLPHLKSSYPLESRPSLGFSHLPITDEDVRTGDPRETIRRASMFPSQIKDSVAAHQLSLAPPPVGATHGRVPHVTKTREVRSTRSPMSTKRLAEQVQDLDTPESKKMVSCFPRTPKGRSLRSANSQNIAPSPSNRRQSMAFTIDNTPKKAGRGDSRLQRGINKLRKSPRTTSSITSSAKKFMKFRKI